MNFVVDAQLPRRMAVWLREHGHDAIHTLDLPEANRTSDAAIVELSFRESRIVITKDADFVDSHILHRRPGKLLLVSTGNISNRELEFIFELNIPVVAAALEAADFVEISRTGVLVHG
jgi:predicted nuclease of predicted toxin-antitoxin system